MGRTRPTYRDLIRLFEADWEPFRRAIRADNQKRWDRLIAWTDQHAMAGGAQNPTDPRWTIVMGMLLEHQRQIDELREAIEVER